MQRLITREASTTNSPSTPTAHHQPHSTKKVASTEQTSINNPDEASDSSHAVQSRPEETLEAREERLQKYQEAFDRARSFEDDEEFFPYGLQTYPEEQSEGAQQGTQTENQTQLEHSFKTQQYQKEKADAAKNRLQEAANKGGVRLSASMNIIVMIAVLLTFFCTALAAPIVPSSAVRPVYSGPSNGTAIAPNTALCDFSFRQVNGGGAAATYNLTIGQPYVNGSYCPILWSVIQANVPAAAIYNFTCGTESIDAVKGDTHVHMEAATDHGTNIAVIDALQHAYSDIPFQRERICLQDGTAPSAAWPSLNGTRDSTPTSSRNVVWTMIATGAYLTSTGTSISFQPPAIGHGPLVNTTDSQHNGLLPDSDLPVRASDNTSFEFTGSTPQ